MRRVLVTGASGYVGRQTLARLSALGFEVYGVARRPLEFSGCTWTAANLLDFASVAKVINDIRPSHILHLAWTTEHGKFWNDPQNTRWRDATLHLLTKFVASGGRRFVMSGTCAEYDCSASEPLSEMRTPLRPQSIYGTSKMEVFVRAQAATRVAGLSFASGRLFFSYGPFEHPQRLIPSIIRALIVGEPARIASGALVRDFMDVRDVGMCLAALLNSEVEGAVNICSGSGVSVGRVAELIAALLGRPDLLELQAQTSPNSGSASIIGENDRLLREVRVSPEITIEDGLSHALGWWRAKLHTGSTYGCRNSRPP